MIRSLSFPKSPFRGAGGVVPSSSASLRLASLALLRVRQKKYDEALSLLENVFSRDPQYVDARRLQSDVLLARGDAKKAVETLERVDQTYPGAPIVNASPRAQAPILPIE